MLLVVVIFLNALRLECSSGLAGSSDVGSDLSNIADLQYDHPASVSHEHRIALSSVIETSRALKPLSVLTSCDQLVTATDKDASWTCSCSVDAIKLSTNEIEDHVSQITSNLRLWFPFTSLIRTTGSPPCVVIVATAVVASEAPDIACFFEKSLCKSLLCRRSQLGTLKVLLLQSFDRWPGLS